MDSPRVRVLVVDDSAFARKVMREVLDASPRIEVVGIARDGLEALEKISELKPDVITLDLVMPGLDGLGVLRALPAEGAPRVVVVTMADEDSELGLAALDAGAVDLVHKPTAMATDRLYELAGELVAKVEAAARARPPRPGDSARRPREPSRSHWAGDAKLLVIGASTGGPQALARLIAALPGDLPVPVGIVLHIPQGYTEAFAKRLDEGSALHVVESSDGLALVPGVVAVARAGLHTRVHKDGEWFRTLLDGHPASALHRPSVDALFESAAAAAGGRVLAVVLTGMGDDGLIGSRAVTRAGGRVLTEAESSCVVYGMPRCVREAGLSDGEAVIADMAAEIVRRL